MVRYSNPNILIRFVTTSTHVVVTHYVVVVKLVRYQGLKVTFEISHKRYGLNKTRFSSIVLNCY